ncbi:MAG: hypothetical protein F9K23_06265 [Bacteroidetes bacterium]|nr:MAG: hypothetical protein F9K23_06265 [Bacteroidota bacterium]
MQHKKHGVCPNITLNIKFRAFAMNIPNGFKPFGMQPYNSDGLYTRLPYQVQNILSSNTR